MNRALLRRKAQRLTKLLDRFAEIISTHIHLAEKVARLGVVRIVFQTNDILFHSGLPLISLDLSRAKIEVSVRVRRVDFQRPEIVIGRGLELTLPQ